MGTNRARRRAVYDRTGGYCHGCGKKLAYSNYGKVGERGAWEEDHSNPRARGGSDHRNNVYAACTYCNRSKRDGSTKALRARNGLAKAPLSREKRRARERFSRRVKIAAGVGGGLLLAAGLYALLKDDKKTNGEGR